VRVLIADDSAFMRKVLSEMFASGRGFEVIGTARNGADAVAKVAELDPDIVTMDVEMPEMNGLTALRKIRAAHGPTRPAVLMCSTLTAAGSETAIAALHAGAADIIAKEHLGIGEEHTAFRAELLSKVRAIGIHMSRASRAPAAAPAAPCRLSNSVVRTRDLDAVVIGSSTGGPPVLERIVTALPGRPTKPIIIAQHMPGLFTRSLAARLDGVGEATVKLGEDGERVLGGTVYIAEGGKHIRVKQTRGEVRLEVSVEPADALYKPSVNELFGSAAPVYGRKALGVMLTGMGDDGCEGAKRMHEAGAPIVAQSADSCVVYGMPRAVVEAGAASSTMGIDRICALISQASGCAGTPILKRSA
jgi:two-component system chemotaxis response regulator CheB